LPAPSFTSSSARPSLGPGAFMGSSHGETILAGEVKAQPHLFAITDRLDAVHTRAICVPWHTGVRSGSRSQPHNNGHRLDLCSSRVRLSTAPRTICSPPGSRSGYRFPTDTNRSDRFADARSPGCVPWQRPAWPWPPSCASCPVAIGPPPSSTAPRSRRRGASAVCATVGELQDLLGLVDAVEVLSLHGDILPSERASAHVVALFGAALAMPRSKHFRVRNPSLA
jgi:hypothetical protein